MTGSVLFWLTLVIFSTAALTALVVAPLAARWATARAEHLAEHEIVQAVLWADHPLDVLRFYARYRPEPPEELDPDQLDRLTRHPDPGTAALATHLVRPAVPEPGASTSHRRQRRPFTGWLEETFKPTPQVADDQADVAIDAELEIIFPVPPADPEPDPMPAAIPAPAGAAAALLTLDPGWRDDAKLCPRCHGATRIQNGSFATMSVTREVNDVPIWRPCPDCCCTWLGCGLYTGGGFCTPHQEADDLAAESEAKRSADV